MNLAPNGKPSNLNAEQYKLVRTPAFKKWFGDWENDPKNASKVVDENGEPLVVYRGSKSKNPNYIPHKHELSKGIYFSTKKEVAELYTTSVWQNWIGRVFDCFLSIKHIDYYDTLKLKSNIYQADFKYYNDLVIESKKNDYDGIRWDNFIDVPDLQSIFPQERIDYIATTFIVFETNQIKLADGTNTTFDANNEDIRYEQGGKISNQKEDDGGKLQYKINNNPVGYLKYYYDLESSITEELSDYKNELYIEMVEVDENYRGKGIAKKLLNKIIDIAKKMGVEVVSLRRDSGLGCDYGGEYDQYLKRIYESVGFVEFNQDCGMILNLKKYSKGGILSNWNYSIGGL